MIPFQETRLSPDKFGQNFESDIIAIASDLSYLTPSADILQKLLLEIAFNDIGNFVH